MRLCIVLGTRPEIVKFSPIIRECQRLNLDYSILHTGQHYSYNLDRVFFEQLNLPPPIGILRWVQARMGNRLARCLLASRRF
jgi:UDP-N-acetylglucosamine 2-epimerase